MLGCVCASVCALQVGPADVGMVAGVAGWQLAATGELRPRRINASHLLLRIPPLPAYRIAAPETVQLTVPAAALMQHHRALVDLGYFFTVTATPGTASLGGSLLHKNASTRLAPPTIAGRTLEIRLLGDTWQPTLESNDDLRRAVRRAALDSSLRIWDHPTWMARRAPP